MNELETFTAGGAGAACIVVALHFTMKVGGVGQGKWKIQRAFISLKKLGMWYLSAFSGMDELLFDGMKGGDVSE
jgi:hypothetical protein